jgi:methyl-accepting chemotaxis protein
MLSLRWKLAIAFLLVVLVSVGLTAYLINRSTESEFGHYVTQYRMGDGAYDDHGHAGNGMGATSQPQYTAAEQDFLDDMSQSLWVAGLAGAGASMVLGLVLTRQITRPIKHLKKGATRIARGDPCNRRTSLAISPGRLIQWPRAWTAASRRVGG